MDAKRLRLKHIAVLVMLLVLVGTLLSFFIAPVVSDKRTRERLGLPEDAFVTDTGRDPWVYVTEAGSVYLYGDKMFGIKRLYIPSAVNGIPLDSVTLFYHKPESIEAVILPATINAAKTFNAFRGWTGMRTLVFSSGTEDVSGSYIIYMPDLEEIYLPASIKKIDKNFLKEDGVTLYYAGTEEEWLALGDGAKRLMAEHTVVFETPLPEWAEK